MVAEVVIFLLLLVFLLVWEDVVIGVNLAQFSIKSTPKKKLSIWEQQFTTRNHCQWILGVLIFWSVSCINSLKITILFLISWVWRWSRWFCEISSNYWQSLGSPSISRIFFSNRKKNDQQYSHILPPSTAWYLLLERQQSTKYW